MIGEHNKIIAQSIISRLSFIPNFPKKDFDYSYLTVYPLKTLARLTTIYLLFFPGSVRANPKSAGTKLISQASITSEDIPDKIILKRFQIIDNQVIPQAEINQLLQPYLLRSLAFAELIEIQQTITQLYIEKGYITSGAYIPPQTIRDRTLKIKIIPGKIEAIEISGLNKLQSEYIRSRIAIATQAPLNQNKLLQALQLLQLNPLIKNISAELAQGINPGGSLLMLDIEEAETSKVSFEINNSSPPSIGSVRYQASLNENNLLGFGDRLNITYFHTEGSNSLADLSYTLPIGAYNSRLRLVHSLNDSQIIAEPFQDLDLDSKSRYYEVSYLQPIYQTSNQDFTLGFGFSHQNSELSLMNVGFPDLSRGSNAAGETRISALRLFQEYSDRSQNYVFASRSQFSLGIDAFNSTINSSDLPDSKFLVWRGQTQYLTKLTDNTKLFLRGDVQIADRPLLSLEQFGVGGALSVRGYDEDRILGDNGLFLSAELRNTIWTKRQWQSSLELNPFFDFGRVWNSDDTFLETNTLASLGVGLQLLKDDDFSARLDYAIPLIDDELEGDSLQEQELHFSVSIMPF